MDRLSREKKTITAMVVMHCKGRHGKGGETCPGCRELLEYALARVEHCRFREHKPVCADCRAHCYNRDMRARITEVMRYAGPRMALRHPYLALMHFVDGRRKPSPEKI